MLGEQLEWEKSLVKSGVLEWRTDDEGRQRLGPAEGKQDELSREAFARAVKRKREELFGLSLDVKWDVSTIEHKRDIVKSKIKEEIFRIARGFHDRSARRGFDRMFVAMFDGENKLSVVPGEKSENRVFLKELFEDTDFIKQLLSEYNHLGDEETHEDSSRVTYEPNIYEGAAGTRTVIELVKLLRIYYPAEADQIAGESVNQIWLKELEKKYERERRLRTGIQQMREETFGDVEDNWKNTQYWMVLPTIFDSLGINIRVDQLSTFNEDYLDRVNHTALLLRGGQNERFSTQSIFLETYRKIYGDNRTRGLLFGLMFPGASGSERKMRQINFDRDELGGEFVTQPQRANSEILLRVFKENGLIDLSQASKQVRVAEFVLELEGEKSIIDSRTEIEEVKKALVVVFDREQRERNQVVDEINTLDLSSVSPEQAMATLAAMQSRMREDQHVEAHEATTEEKEARAVYDQLIHNISRRGSVREVGWQAENWSRDRIIVEIKNTGVLPTTEQSKKIVRAYIDAIDYADYHADPDASWQILITARELTDFARLTGFVPKIDEVTKKHISKAMAAEHREESK